MANPPFSEKVWGYEVWANGDPFGRDVHGCPPKGYGDLAFVQHMVASLKPEGILGVVVPNGVLFRGGRRRPHSRGHAPGRYD
jgi:type I restriction enzyme M protein